MTPRTPAHTHYLKLQSANPNASQIRNALSPELPTLALPYLQVTTSSPTPRPQLVALASSAHPACALHAHQIALRVDGMTCGTCASRVQAALAAVPGVFEPAVDLSAALATLVYATTDAHLSDTHTAPLLHCVRALGKQPTLLAAHPIRHLLLRRVPAADVHPLQRLLADQHRVVRVHFEDHRYVAVQFAGAYQDLLDAMPPSHGYFEPFGARTVTLRVDGMMCRSCVAAVTSAIHSVPGASDVSVRLEEGIATLRFDAADSDALADVVQEKTGKVTTVVAEQMLVVTEPRLPPPARTVVLRVDGMTCNGCVGKVAKSLRAVEGANDVDVSLEQARATLRFHGQHVDVLVDAVKEGAGKVATVLEDKLDPVAPVREGSVQSVENVSLRVEGMTCNSCVGAVTKALQAVQGTSNVHVSLADAKATLLFEGDDTSVLVNAVRESAGKVASVVDQDATLDADHALVDVELQSPQQPDVSPSAPIPKPEEARSPVSSVTSIEVLSITQLRVGGMTCSSCVSVVEDVLKTVYGVSTAKVNLLAGRATVHHDAATKPEALAKAISNAGYQGLVLETVSPTDTSKTRKPSSSFRIAFCTDGHANNAAKTLSLLDSVQTANATGCTVAVVLKPGYSKSTVIYALEADGGFGKFIPKLSDADERDALQQGASAGPTDVIDEEARSWRKRFFLSLSFMIPIMAISIMHHRMSMLSMGFVRWSTFILATPIQFGFGAGFYRASYYALKKKRATMDVLVALSTSIAYFSSLFVLLLGTTSSSGQMGLGHSAMFNVSAMIITMVLAGKWIESAAKRRAAAGVAALSALTPDHAVLYDAREKKTCMTPIPVGLLKCGDIVKLNAGDRVPVDGQVIQGSSSVDESMLTGESAPVPKRTEDVVYGGTVNGRGSMLVRTTAVGSDAVLSQIVKLVNDAQTARAPIEAFADKVSAVFVPTVVSLSLLVFVGWFSAASFGWIPAEWYAEEGAFYFALLFALETMVIACPCALGLATPTAVMVASEMGTKLGVLFRGGGAALQAASHIKTVLFDKTGTLTIGKPEVVSVLFSESCSSQVDNASVVLSDLISMVEGESHHPLAEAISRYTRLSEATQGYRKLEYELSDIEELPGRGVQASINKGEFQVRIGSREWAYGAGGAKLESSLLSEKELATVERMESEDGLTVVTAVINECMVVVYGLEDTLRPEAVAVVRYLHGMNIRCGLVTGDSEETARAIAQKVGLDASVVVSRAMPWTKVDVVHKARENGPVAFIGDGINDAPALAAADVGVAIGAGAGVAVESAAVVLVGSDLKSVVNTLDLAKATLRRVRLNFVWAIGYNMMGIPIAAGILYPYFGIRVPPFVASGAMALSSTCVIVSSLALRWYKSPSVTDGTEVSHEDGTRMVDRNVFTIDDDDEEIVARPLLNGEQNV